jgi:hypothetical protein
MSSRERKRFGLRCRNFDSDDGVDFARGRICGDHRRVISGRHLSKHDTDRETYMDEYHFSPDELIVKDFQYAVLAVAFTPTTRATGLLR